MIGAKCENLLFIQFNYKPTKIDSQAISEFYSVCKLKFTIFPTKFLI